MTKYRLALWLNFSMVESDLSGFFNMTAGNFFGNLLPPEDEHHREQD